jgi:hypothetical protein
MQDKYDFTEGKRGAVVEPLRKTRITAFCERAAQIG